MKTNLPVTQKEVILGDDTSIISTTDLKGVITYVNQDFVQVSGFSEAELLGSSHNVVRHPDMPPEAFRDLWETVKAGRPWHGIVKNRCKSGDHYWVSAYVTPIHEHGRVIGYQSVRDKPTREQVSEAERIYQQLRSKQITRLPKRRGILDIGLRIRIFASLFLLAALAVAVAVTSARAMGELSTIVAHQAADVAQLRNAWEGTRHRITGIPEAQLSDLDARIAALSHTGDGQDYVQAVTAVGHAAGTVNIVICLVGLVAIAIIGTLMSRTVIRPMRLINDLSRGMASGDLRQGIEVRHTDEVGEMLQSMRLLQARLRTVMGLFANASSDLTTAAERLSANSGQTLRDMGRQQEQTTLVVTAMQEMAGTIEEIAHSAALAAERARDSEREAESGRAVVAETRDAIVRLAQEVERSGEVVHELVRHSANIGAITEAISGVAEQTNLLALNAAIEAARAGESGRGFTVVADEVRELARRTQEATLRINETVEQLRRGVFHAEEVMRQGSARAAAAVERAGHTERSFERITQAIAAISDMSARIATATEEHQSVAAAMYRNVETIEQLATGTTRAAGEIAGGSAELVATAGRLRHMTTQYRLRSGSRHS